MLYKDCCWCSQSGQLVIMSSWPRELDCLHQQRRVVGQVGVAAAEGELRHCELVGVGSLRRLPPFREPVAFQHANHLRHPRPVAREVLCAKESHLHHLLEFDPVVAAPQALVNQHIKFLLLVHLLHLIIKQCCHELT